MTEKKHDGGVRRGRGGSRVNDFCARYQIGRTTFYEEVKSGDLEFIKVGNCTIVPTEFEDRWLERKRRCKVAS